MNRVICGLIGISLSGLVFAGDYEDAVDDQRWCNRVGEFGGLMYDASRQTDSEYSKNNMLNLAVRVSKNDYELRLHNFAINYAFDNATSKHDAVMTAWAKCIDTRR
jgi:hypothetical protein